MTFTVAVSGKGGTGKTTVAALIIRALTEQFGETVLAVDADPNSTLGMMFGVRVTETVSDLREDVVEKRVKVDPGASRERQIEMMIHETLVECEGFDLLTMGRPEGPKCYCYVNHMLRNFLDGLSTSAPFVVIDNQAGMEHLSRLTTNDVNLLLEVATPTVADIVAARRIDELVGKLPIKVARKGLVINRELDHTSGVPERNESRPGAPDKVEKPLGGPQTQFRAFGVPARGLERVERLIAEGRLELLGRIPLSETIAGLSAEGKPITKLSLDDPAAKAVTEIVKRCVLGKGNTKTRIPDSKPGGA